MRGSAGGCGKMGHSHASPKPLSGKRMGTSVMPRHAVADIARVSANGPGLFDIGRASANGPWLLDAASIMRLQRLVGNSAVVATLQRAIGWPTAATKNATAR